MQCCNTDCKPDTDVELWFSSLHKTNEDTAGRAQRYHRVVSDQTVEQFCLLLSVSLPERVFVFGKFVYIDFKKSKWPFQLPANDKMAQTHT